MVLHNSKWDRKAKYQYKKKHGLLKSQQNPQQTELKDNKQEEAEENDEEEEVLSENEELENEQPEDSLKLEQFIGNDLFTVSKEKNDEEQAYYVKLTKSIAHDYKVPGNSESKPKNNKLLGELDFDTIAKLSLESIHEEISNKSKIKSLSTEEIQNFRELEKKIENENFLRKVKKKFREIPKSELESKDVSFENNLSELIGNKLNLEEDEINNEDIFNLKIEKLDNNNNNNEDKINKKPILQKKIMALDDEKMLDELLGL